MSPGPAGSGRFRRLSKAAQEGRFAPPADLRYLCKACKASPSERSVESDIVSYLQSIYASVAETLPDIKDNTKEDDDVKINVLTEPFSEQQDDYAAAVASQIMPTKSQKPRKFKRSVRILRADAEVRYLPPGHMRDYWLQMNAARDGLNPVSFSQFWRDSYLHLWLVIMNVNCCQTCGGALLHFWQAFSVSCPRFGTASSPT